MYDCEAMKTFKENINKPQVLVADLDEGMLWV